MIKRENDRLIISGKLNMSTVTVVYETGLPLLSAEDLMVDMAQVESVDSAAVSLLLSWSRVVQALGRVLRVKNIPADLLTLAKLYGVTDMLPQQL